MWARGRWGSIATSLLVLAACSEGSAPSDAGLFDADWAIDARPGDDATARDDAGASAGLDAAVLDATGVDAAPRAAYPHLGPDLDPPTPYHRVELSNEGGQLTITRVSFFDARAGVDAPVHARRGDLLAVSRVGATLHEVVPVRFASVLLEEGAADDGTRYSETSSITSATTTVFVRADEGVDHLEIVDDTGTIRASAPLPAHHLRFVDSIAPELPYAVLLTDDAELARLPARLRSHVVSILTPNEADRAVLLDAFRQVNPAARGAIHVVALALFPDEGRKTLANGKVVVTLAYAFGDAMILNATFLSRARSDFVETVVHEGAHNFNFLVDDLEGDPARDTTPGWVARWPEEYRAQVATTLARRALADSLTKFWIDLHVSAQVNMLASPYLGDDWATLTDAAAIRGGFASNYGARNAAEDIAEYAMTIQAVGPTSALCRDLAGAGRIDGTRVVNWAKATFLVGLGLVGEEAMAACLGSTELQTVPGVFVGADALVASNDLRVRVTTDNSELADPAARELCPGRALCGRFAPTPRTVALTLEAGTRYGPYGFAGQVPPGWTPGTPLDYHFFQLGIVNTAGGSLVGVRRVTKRDSSPLVGGVLRPIANTLYANSPMYDVFLGSDETGFVVITHADQERFEGVLLFETMLYVAGRSDPRDGTPALAVPLTTFRVDRPPAASDPCCP